MCYNQQESLLMCTNGYRNMLIKIFYNSKCGIEVFTYKIVSFLKNWIHFCISTRVNIVPRFWGIFNEWMNALLCKETAKC